MKIKLLNGSNKYIIISDSESNSFKPLSYKNLMKIVYDRQIVFTIQILLSLIR